jgi:5-formyltetrahydrofolate cyclo-ligase
MTTVFDCPGSPTWAPPTPKATPTQDKASLRPALLAHRRDWMQHPAHAERQHGWRATLESVLHHMASRMASAKAPSSQKGHRSITLGLYVAIKDELNVTDPLPLRPHGSNWTLSYALPYAYKKVDGHQNRMHYRQWTPEQGTEVRDEMGIPSTTGQPVTPDVIVLPCVGFNASGQRLGYGAGYYDRWLFEHPNVICIGVALTSTYAAFEPASHDHALSMIVTEKGVFIPPSR